MKQHTAPHRIDPLTIVTNENKLISSYFNSSDVLKFIKMDDVLRY